GYSIYARGGWDPAIYGELRQRLARGAAGADAAKASDATARRTPDARARDAQAGDWRQPPVGDDRRFADLQQDALRAERALRKDREARLVVDALPNCIVPGEHAEQARAREELFPAPPPAADNEWGKGLPSRRTP